MLQGAQERLTRGQAKTDALVRIGIEAETPHDITRGTLSCAQGGGHRREVCETLEKRDEEGTG